MKKKPIVTPSVQNSALDTPPNRLTFAKARTIASRFGVCSKTIFRWADAGLIHRHKINGRVVLFDVAEIERFITKSTAKAVTKPKELSSEQN